MNDLMTRSFLNYAELKKQAQKDLRSEELYQTETVASCSPEDEVNLSFFFQDVEQIQTQMAEITTLLQDLQVLNEDTKSVHTSRVLRELRDKLDSKTTSISRKVMAVKTRIEHLSKSNIKNRQVSIAFREGTAVDRTRMAITNGLKYKFKDTMGDFAALRNKIVDEQKDEKPKPIEEMVVDQISVLDSGKSKKKAMDLECNERHEAMVDIRKSLDRLQQVFLDMSVLVEEQEGQIDDIEKNMESSGMYINGGTNSLYYAKQTKKKANKKLYWIWAIGLMILLVCLIAGLSS